VNRPPTRSQRQSLTVPSVANAVSANLLDSDNLPFDKNIIKVTKEQGWISDEYEHLWRRDEGGSAALTSRGILSTRRFL
jgi:hypothetical protein